MSVSHLLADGYTYYTLYKMLSEDQPAKALVAERVHDFEKRRVKIMDGLDDYNWLQSVPTTIGLVKTLLFHKKPNIFIQDYDLDLIKKEKEMQDS